MKKIILVAILILTITGCKKWTTNYKSNVFRNQFVGKWTIDSIKYETDIDTTGLIFRSQVFNHGENYFLSINESIDKNQDDICYSNLLNHDMYFVFQNNMSSETGNNKRYGKPDSFLSFSFCEHCPPLHFTFLEYLSGFFKPIEFTKNKKLTLLSEYADVNKTGYIKRFLYLSQ